MNNYRIQYKYWWGGRLSLSYKCRSSRTYSARSVEDAIKQFETEKNNLLLPRSAQIIKIWVQVMGR